ncbi:MAG: hypothetical protein AB8B73_05950, partial [Ekhidna sp.]
RTLVRLALVDNRLEESELVLLKEYVKIHQIDTTDSERIMKDELENKGNDSLVPLNLDFQGKIEVLADLVKVMKADGKVFLSEIRFCEMVAKMFGLEPKSIGFLSEMVHTDNNVPINWELVEKKMKDFVS